MKSVFHINQMPTTPGVYALCSGQGAYRHVAYIGSSDNLRRRIYHHLVRKSSSVVTGEAAVSLNADLVTEVDWWEHEAFSEQLAVESAELVAFDVLKPTLRSRLRAVKARDYLNADPAFQSQMFELFKGEPTGRLTRLSVQQQLEAALIRIQHLEDRVSILTQEITTVRSLVEGDS